MSCRCSDIRACNKDIRNMESALRYLNQLMRKSEDVKMDLSDTASVSAETYMSTFIGEINQSVLGLDKFVVSTITGTQKKIESKLKYCYQTLPRMEREDEYYHEEDDD